MFYAILAAGMTPSRGAFASAFTSQPQPGGSGIRPPTIPGPSSLSTDKPPTLGKKCFMLFLLNRFAFISWNVVKSPEHLYGILFVVIFAIGNAQRRQRAFPWLPASMLKTRLLKCSISFR